MKTAPGKSAINRRRLQRLRQIAPEYDAHTAHKERRTPQACAAAREVGIELEGWRQEVGLTQCALADGAGVARGSYSSFVYKGHRINLLAIEALIQVLLQAGEEQA